MSNTIVCSKCMTHVAHGLLSCPKCHRLVHTEKLKELSNKAEAAEQREDIVEAISLWRSVKELLPLDSGQCDVVVKKITKLARTEGGGRFVHWMKDRCERRGRGRGPCMASPVDRGGADQTLTGGSHLLCPEADEEPHEAGEGASPLVDTLVGPIYHLGSGIDWMLLVVHKTQLYKLMSP